MDVIIRPSHPHVIERSVLPIIRTLAPEKVQTLEDKGKGVRKLTEERYDQVIAEFEQGDYGELIPDFGEKRLTARNRLKAAAARRVLSLHFRRGRGEVMRFKVEVVNRAAKPVRRIR